MLPAATGSPSGTETGHDVFLAHSSSDKPAVRFIAHKLREHGIRVWLDEWNLIPGTHWQPAIEEAISRSAAVAVFYGPLGGKWQEAEGGLALMRQISADSERIRVIPVLLPSGVKANLRHKFISLNTWVEFGDTLDDAIAIRRLISGIRGEEPGPGPGPIHSECPYRGLAPFDIAHAPFFFGRKAVTQKLVAVIESTIRDQSRARCCGIVGASGSGKSSVARAGVLHNLEQNAIKGSSQWKRVVLRPGIDPVDSLALAVESLYGDGNSEARIHERTRALRESSHALHLSIENALGDGQPGRYCVVFVDQFEEVFAPSIPEATRAAWIDSLMYAATVPEGRSIIFFTLRADRYSECARYASLREVIPKNHELLASMSADELRSAVKNPANEAGVEIKPDLVEKIIADCEDQPNCLPLMQYVLRMLWDNRAGGPLTHEAYLRTGGIRGALNHRAEDVYARLSPEQQQICRIIFMGLSDVAPGRKPYRRQRPLSELTGSEDPVRVKAVEEVIATLAGSEARLITTSALDEFNAEVLVDLSHEALLSSWVRLKTWLQDDEEFLLWKQRLNVKASDWERKNGASGTHLQGALLREALKWREKRGSEMSQPELAYIDASVRTARVAKRKLLAVVAGVCVVLIAAVATVLYFKRVADADRLLTAAQNVIASNPELAAVLVMESARIHSSAQAESLLHEAVQASTVPPIEHENRNLPVNALDISNNGEFVATAGQDGTARVWNPQHEEIRRFEPGAEVQAARFSPDGKRLAAVTRDGKIRVWLWESERLVFDRMDPGATLTSVAFSPDGNRLAASGADGVVRLWDMTQDSQNAQSLPAAAGVSLNAVAYSSDGNSIVAGGNDGRVFVWNTDTLRLAGDPLDAKTPVVGIQPGGQSRVLTVSTAGAARIWDLDSRDEVFRFPESVDNVGQGAITRDGGTIATASVDSITLTDVGSGRVKLRIRQPFEATQMCFSPQGTRLLVATRSGKVRVYEMNPNSLRGVALASIQLGLPSKLEACRQYISTDRCEAYASGRLPGS